MVKPWGKLQQAKVLIIGHDARLQNSETLANYAFFADYFFNPIPDRPSERAKYNLAANLFSYVGYLTSYKYTAEQYFLTNLCNEELSHSPKGKTVYIPENKAEKGIADIKKILESSEIEMIFAMSQQVNYWLHYFGFYDSESNFFSLAEPKKTGINSSLPYYAPKGKSAFLKICGKKYNALGKYQIYPILHVKNWPLKGAFKETYEKSYIECQNQLKD